MADGEKGAGEGGAPEGAGKAAPVLGGAAPAAGTEAPKLGDLTGETWRLHLAGGDAELAKRFDRFTDIGKLGASFVEMEKRWSDPRTARLPGPLPENATDEQKAAHAKERRDFFSKLGVPEAADKYDIKIAADAPETVKQGVDLIKAAGVDLGLTNEAANGLAAKLAEWQTATDAQFATEAAAAEEKGLAALKEQWGGDYEPNLKIANAAGAHFFGEQFAAFMETQLADGTRLGQNPVLIQMLAQIGREFQSDPIFSKFNTGGASLDTVQAQIDKINALRDGTRAGNAAYDAKRDELLRLIDTKRKLTQAA